MFRTRCMTAKGKAVLVLNDISGSGHQLEIFAISNRSKPIKSKKSLNISDENGDPIEILAARFCQNSETEIEIVYGMVGAVIWEKIEISDHTNIERTIYKKSSKKGKDQNEMNGKVNRVTGESAIRKRRLESINESDMTMAERLGKKSRN